jgi:DNA polymerase-3 subunit epsilon
MKFAVLDVETVNRDRHSICQIGVAIATARTIIRKWSVLIHPNVEFDPFVCGVHGISPSDVQAAPSFEDIHAELNKLLSGHTVYQYANSKFDQQAIEGACLRYDLPVPEVEWRDATQLVRKTWLDVSDSGYDLPSVCEMLGIKYRKHDALEDACAAAMVVQRALARAESNGVSSTFNESSTANPDRRQAGFGARIKSMDGREGLPLSGKCFLFSEVSDKRELADEANKLGADVKGGFSRKITHLVTSEKIISGIQPPTDKYSDALKAIGEGRDVKIISEADFRAWTLSLGDSNFGNK